MRMDFVLMTGSPGRVNGYCIIGSWIAVEAVRSEEDGTRADPEAESGLHLIVAKGGDGQFSVSSGADSPADSTEYHVKWSFDAKKNPVEKR